MNNATMSICVQIFMWTYVFSSLSFILGVIKPAGSYACSMLNVWRTAKLFSKEAVPFYISSSNAWGFRFFYILANICYCLFYYNHPIWWKVVSYCGFTCIFQMANVLHFFKNAYCPFVYLFSRNVCSDPLPIFFLLVNKWGLFF